MTTCIRMLLVVVNDYPPDASPGFQVDAGFPPSCTSLISPCRQSVLHMIGVCAPDSRKGCVV
jgi:hypothetical protein